MHLLRTKFDLNVIARQDVFNTVFREEIGPHGRGSSAIESRYGMRLKQVELWQPILDPTEESREVREALMVRIRDAIAEVARKHAEQQGDKPEDGESQIIKSSADGIRLRPKQKDEYEERHTDTIVPAPPTKSARSQQTLLQSTPTDNPPAMLSLTDEGYGAVTPYSASLKRLRPGKKPKSSTCRTKVKADNAQAPGTEIPCKEQDKGEPSDQALTSPWDHRIRPSQLPTLASLMKREADELPTAQAKKDRTRPSQLPSLASLMEKAAEERARSRIEDGQ